MNKEDLIVIYLNPRWKPGLFSYVHRTLIKMCDVYPSKVYVDWNHPTAYQNECGIVNLWDLVWEQPDVENIDEYNLKRIEAWNTETVRDGCLIQDLYYPTYDERVKAKKLIDEKFRLNPEIKNIIDTFYNTNMKGKKVLSIHRRGCTYGGKRSPATPLCTDDEFNKNLLYIIQSNNFDVAFIASDNEESKINVISFVENLGLKTISYDSHIAVNTLSYGIMFDDVPSDGSLLVKEVVIEAYLMSMAHSIYMGGSGVTIFTLYLNPELKDYYIERDY